MSAEGWVSVPIPPALAGLPAEEVERLVRAAFARAYDEYILGQLTAGAENPEAGGKP